MTLITLRFAPEMEDAILAGKKCCTSRKNKKGEVGDLFVVKDRLYRIVHVHHCLLYSVRDAYYDAEGFAYPGDFQEFWITHIGKFDPGQIAHLHFFAYVTELCPDFNLGCNSCIPDLCPASEVCNYGD
ncbi:MAG: ASCH domain-containing protein [Methanoregula sp.]|jgi:hypothetical protein|nr:ASCH domain-containing protein [Methanoregula sp.]